MRCNVCIKVCKMISGSETVYESYQQAKAMTVKGIMHPALWCTQIDHETSKRQQQQQQRRCRRTKVIWARFFFRSISFDTPLQVPWLATSYFILPCHLPCLTHRKKMNTGQPKRPVQQCLLYYYYYYNTKIIITRVREGQWQKRVYIPFLEISVRKEYTTVNV